jgi:hypothetical protein
VSKSRLRAWTIRVHRVRNVDSFRSPLRGSGFVGRLGRRISLLDLSMEERRLITRILERAYGDLRSEIYKTDSPSMKDELKREEALLGGILEKLGIHRAAGAR